MPSPAVRLFRPFLLLLALSAALPAPIQAQTNVVKMWNWTDYIEPSVLEEFTRETGITVEYHTFDSSEALEEALKKGRSGYDVVVPSSAFLALGRAEKLFQPLDLRQIPNSAGVDKQLLQATRYSDPGHDFGVPYLWGTNLFAIRRSEVEKRLGGPAPARWELMLDPRNLQKFADCGVAFLDSPSEVLPEVLRHLGKLPGSNNPSDLYSAEKHLKTLVPHILYFGTDEIIDDLATGKLCAAFSYSGDLAQAVSQARENGITDLELILPDNGAELWVDFLAVPADAPNPLAAHKLINFLLKPATMAKISNTVQYANPVPASWKLVDKELAENRVLFPDEAARSKLYLLPIKTPAMAGMEERIWNKVAQGKRKAGE